MKLEIELVPKTAWDKNLRLSIPRKEWDKIRKESYAKANHKCAICGADGQLNCHEIWEYDDENHIQKLTGFIALCKSCHMIKHIGLAETWAYEGRIDMEKLIRHFMKVNNVDFKEFENHRRESFELWKKRSEENWATDFDQWSDLVNDS